MKEKLEGLKTKYDIFIGTKNLFNSNSNKSGKSKHIFVLILCFDLWLLCFTLISLYDGGQYIVQIFCNDVV